MSLIMFVIGSVGFFALHLFTSMAGGGRTSVVMAWAGAGLAAGGVLLRIVGILWTLL